MGFLLQEAILQEEYMQLFCPVKSLADTLSQWNLAVGFGFEQVQVIQDSPDQLYNLHSSPNQSVGLYRI